MKSLSLSQPHLIIMVGVPGSGKSFFAEKFAETFHAPYIALEKIAPLTSGEAAAKELQTYQLNELLKTKQPIIIEGGADTRAERAELSKKARSARYQALFIWVQTDSVTAKSRLTKPSKSTPHRTITTDEYDQASRRFAPPSAIERPVVVISGKHTYATQVKVVLKKLSAPRADIPLQPPAATPERQQPGRRSNIIIR